MNKKGIVIAGLILAALAAYIIFVDNPAMEERERKESEEGRVFDLTGDDVSTLNIRREKDEDILLVKEDGRWFMIEPIRSQADESGVDDILYELENLERKGELKAGEREKYGLRPPRFEVAFSGEDIEGALAVGKGAPVGEQVYASAAGDVILIDARSAGNMDKTAGDLRFKGIVDFEPYNVNGIVFVRPVEAELVKEGDWRILSPVETDADNDFIRDFLYDLSRMEALEFLSEEAGAGEIAEYGLDTPDLELILEGDRGTSPVVMSFGDDNIYGLRKGDGKILRLETSLFKEDYRNPDLTRIRRKEAFPLFRRAVEGFSLAYDDVALSCEKGEEARWILIEPESTARISEEKIETFLENALDVKAESFIDEPVEDGGYGFDDPYLTLTLSSKDGSYTITVGDKEGSLHYAGAGDMDEILLVPSYKIEMLKIDTSYLTGPTQ